MASPISISRRTFLGSAAALPLAMKSMADTHLQHAQWLFLGTQDGEGIYRAPWNAQTGEIGLAELAVKTERPDFFALHPTLPILYTTNEREGDAAALSSFHIDAAHGKLTLINQEPTHGDDPCFVSLDHTGRLAFAANYSSGSLTTFSLDHDGKLSAPVSIFDGRHDPQRGKTGPVAGRQDAAHFHCAIPSPGNTAVLACDLGTDSIFVFPISSGSSKALGKPQRFATRPGSGPRHLAFHGDRLYCIHEIDCTVDLFLWNETTRTLHPQEGSATSMLAPGTPLTGNTAAELMLAHDGRFAYTCTRGTNELVTFRIDPATGLLTEHQRLSCGGQTPRLIAFDPTRRYLLCANQDSSTVTVFGHDPATGMLSASPKTFSAPSPMCFAFV